MGSSADAGVCLHCDGLGCVYGMDETITTVFVIVCLCVCEREGQGRQTDS